MQFQVAIGQSLLCHPVFIFAQCLTLSSVFLVCLFTCLVIIYLPLLGCSVRPEILSLWFIPIFLEVDSIWYLKITFKMFELINKTSPDLKLSNSISKQLPK